MKKKEDKKVIKWNFVSAEIITFARLKMKRNCRDENTNWKIDATDSNISTPHPKLVSIASIMSIAH
jgi:hypothetical protein